MERNDRPNQPEGKTNSLPADVQQPPIEATDPFAEARRQVAEEDKAWAARQAAKHGIPAEQASDLPKYTRGFNTVNTEENDTIPKKITRRALGLGALGAALGAAFGIGRTSDPLASGHIESTPPSINKQPGSNITIESAPTGSSLTENEGLTIPEVQLQVSESWSATARHEPFSKLAESLTYNTEVIYAPKYSGVKSISPELSIRVSNEGAYKAEKGKVEYSPEISYAYDSELGELAIPLLSTGEPIIWQGTVHVDGKPVRTTSGQAIDLTPKSLYTGEQNSAKDLELASEVTLDQEAQKRAFDTIATLNRFRAGVKRIISPNNNIEWNITYIDDSIGITIPAEQFTAPKYDKEATLTLGKKAAAAIITRVHEQGGSFFPDVHDAVRKLEADFQIISDKRVKERIPKSGERIKGGSDAPPPNYLRAFGVDNTGNFINKDNYNQEIVDITHTPTIFSFVVTRLSQDYENYEDFYKTQLTDDGRRMADALCGDSISILRSINGNDQDLYALFPNVPKEKYQEWEDAAKNFNPEIATTTGDSSKDITPA